MSRTLWSSQPNHIRRFRKRRNLRLRDVADKLGLNQPGHIADWEKGRRSPSLQNALKLSAILGCPIEVLFSDHFRTIRTDIRRPTNENLATNKNKHDREDSGGEELTASGG